MAASEVAAEHATEAHAPYLKVFAALAVLTAIEYYYASIFKRPFRDPASWGCCCLAVVKAGLVGWYFMHLKFEGNWVYIMIVPAMILATIIVLALCPDMVLKSETEENPGEEYACIVPGSDWPPVIVATRNINTDDRCGNQRPCEYSLKRTPCSLPRASTRLALVGCLEAARASTSLPFPHDGQTNVSKSYRLGVQIVLGTVLISGIVCWTWVIRVLPKLRLAAHDLGSAALASGRISVSRAIRPHVRHTDLNDRVWVAAFIFTRCPLSCPRISSVMKGLQERLAQDERASRQHLGRSRTRHAGRVDGVRGPIRRVRRSLVVSDRAQGVDLRPCSQSLQARAGGNAGCPTEHPRPKSISHSDRLALVDHGRVVGFFESSDPRALDELVGERPAGLQPRWVRGLPTVNASLNALCAVLLIAGWLFIRRRRTPLADPFVSRRR